MNLVRRRPDIEYSYDEEADVLYLSFGKPMPATGVDLQATLVLRLDEESNQVVGLTVVGLRRGLEAELAEDKEPAGVVR
jgi:uncharacterized protein YuzE